MRTLIMTALATTAIFSLTGCEEASESLEVQMIIPGQHLKNASVACNQWNVDIGWAGCGEIEIIWLAPDEILLIAPDVLEGSIVDMHGIVENKDGSWDDMFCVEPDQFAPRFGNHELIVRFPDCSLEIYTDHELYPY